MIKRIVRMVFMETKTEDFEKIFKESKEKIRNFEGCEYLSLHRDHNHQNIYYTLSYWKDTESLESYRSSTLFKETWAKTKILFKEKPMAFSLDELIELL